jgi:replicative DNA helicase
LLDSKGKAEVIVAKLRQGQTGTVTVPFDPIRQHFGQPAQEPPASLFGIAGGGA